MTEAERNEVREAFQELGRSHPVTRGLLRILEEEEQAEKEAVAAPGVSSEGRHFNAGRLARMMDLRTDVEELLKGP